MSHDIEYIKQQKGFKVVHVNIRSLLKHFEEVETLFLDGIFDVVILTETWLHVNVADSLISSDLYNVTRLDRQTRSPSGATKVGGGIAIYIKNGLNFDYIVNDVQSTDDIELMHVTLRFEHQKDIDIWGVYRPPNGNYQRAIETLTGCLEIDNKPNEIVLIGDFNVDLSNATCSKKKSLTKLIDSYALKSLITTATRITNVTSTVIDHIYTNVNYVSMCGTLNINIADHLPVFLIKKKERVHKEFVEIQCRSLSEECREQFATELLSQVETISFESGDPNVVWHEFYQTIVALFDRYCPIRTIKIRANPQSYIDTELCLLMKQRDRAFRTARRYKRPEDWQVARRLRSAVQTSLRKAKRKFILNQLSCANGDGKKFWQVRNDSFLKSPTKAIVEVFTENTRRLVKGKAVG